MPTNFAMFTDTHTHLTHPALFFRLPQIIAQARAAQVSQFIVPTAEYADWAHALALLRQPEIRAVALGIHPWYAEQASDSALHELAQHLHQHPTLLVGEIGLAFYDKNHAPKRRRRGLRAGRGGANRKLKPNYAHYRKYRRSKQSAAKNGDRRGRHN